MHSCWRAKQDLVPRPRRPSLDMCVAAPGSGLPLKSAPFDSIVPQVNWYVHFHFEICSYRLEHRRVWRNILRSQVKL